MLTDRPSSPAHHRQPPTAVTSHRRSPPQPAPPPPSPPQSAPPPPSPPTAIAPTDGGVGGRWVGFPYEEDFLFEEVFGKQTPSKPLLAEVWSTSSAKEVCRCGPQTADVLPLQKQTAP
ncbi:hypothetical protein E3N88_23287 [Mikania micrantha]|uniref:Uncharacterized protein n=1 Tax=Mikania micrantha TaxID=192012 RepID=A0A5N6NCV4_9ASTR|nr:hypothetical protein E3N88_23287 [Mikania micrantha]